MTEPTHQIIALDRANPQGRSLLGDATRRFVRSPLALFGMAIVLLMIVVAIFADKITPYGLLDCDLGSSLTTPSPDHILGTDDIGCDVFSRILYGTRVSLSVSILSMAFGLVVGTVAGLLAGFYGGIVDTLLMRLTDVFLAFPLLLLAIAIVAALGPGENSAFLALGIVTWPYVARLARGQALSLKNQEYVTAARALGASDRRVLLVHILPNMLTPLIVYGTVGIANTILAESALAFLGLGAQPPTPSWGGMLADTRTYLLSAPWLPTYPGLAILFTAFGFNLLGDGLRDVFDVRAR